jgi:cell division protein FtsL
MLRTNLVLVAIALASALSGVNAQHKARKLFTELEREQERMRQLEVEWGQLQLEQSTWAAHARIEKFARERLRMTSPAPAQILTVEAGGTDRQDVRQEAPTPLLAAAGGREEAR